MPVTPLSTIADTIETLQDLKDLEEDAVETFESQLLALKSSYSATTHDISAVQSQISQHKVAAQRLQRDIDTLSTLIAD